VKDEVVEEKQVEISVHDSLDTYVDHGFSQQVSDSLRFMEESFESDSEARNGIEKVR
jgi:hypothetical protein